MNLMKPIILGSSSPRRAQFLTEIGVDFHQVSIDYDETFAPLRSNQTLQNLAETLVLSKMHQLRQHLIQDQRLWPQNCTTVNDCGLLLVADTLVVSGAEILGKPASVRQARSMLLGLSGQVHQVITGVVVGNFEQQEVVVTTTQVQFRQLTINEIDIYIETREPFDKAGAYGLQGLGGSFVTQVQGSVSSVIGLPLAETQAMLNRWGQAHTLSSANY